MPQYLSLYQLENLQRAQTKFILVVLTDSSRVVPTHPLLKADLVLDATEASAQIQSHFTELACPSWWPVVLISLAGLGDAEVAKNLESHGLINVYSYRGGWSALLAGT